LSQDPRFADNASRIEHGEELKALLAQGFRKKTSAEWLRELEAIDFLCSPVSTLEEALDDPQVRHNQMVIEFDHPQGRVRAVGSPVKLVDTPAAVRIPPPLLGEHNDQILGELGYTAEQIETLRTDCVVL
jgi:formyl-CoA transferase